MNKYLQKIANNQIQKLQQQLKELNNKLIILKEQDQNYINKFEQELDIKEKRRIMLKHNNFRNNELNVVINTIKSIKNKIQQIQLRDQFNNNINNSNIGDKIQIIYNPSFDQDMSAAIYINNELITDKFLRNERSRLSHNQLRDEYLKLNNIIQANIEARIIFNNTIAIILSNQSNINNQQLAQLIHQQINSNLLVFAQDDSVKELTRLAKKVVNIIINYLGV